MPAVVQVRQKPAAGAELVKDIARFVSGNYPGGESGIVYVLTRKDAETLAEVGVWLLGRASTAQPAAAAQQAACHPVRPSCPLP